MRLFRRKKESITTPAAIPTVSVFVAKSKIANQEEIWEEYVKNLDFPLEERTVDFASGYAIVAPSNEEALATKDEINRLFQLRSAAKLISKDDKDGEF